MAPQGQSAAWLIPVFAAGAFACFGSRVAAQADGSYPAPETAHIEPPVTHAEPAGSGAEPELPPAEAALESPSSEPGLASSTPPAQELPTPAAQLDEGPPQPEPVLAAVGIGNQDVLDMTSAEFGETTILAAIAANPTRFDVSPRALVALKNSGVSERVIEAMLASEAAKKQAAAAAVAAAPPQSESAMSPEAFAKLSQMIEDLAAQQEAAAVAAAARSTPPPIASKPPAVEPPAAAPQTPRAWIAADDTKVELAPTIAQVAFTDERGFGKTFKTLGGLAGKALAFVNPSVGGIATTLGGLFRSDEPDQTAVWALAGTSAARNVDGGVVFEVELANIPGVDPDAYRPALVQLVPTNDNYRLVAAAKTEGPSQASRPSGPIIEEPVATDVTRLDRGRYRAAAQTKLGAGEYALVLRPVEKNERRRRSSSASLGELLGGGTSQILYLTWDFAVRG